MKRLSVNRKLGNNQKRKHTIWMHHIFHEHPQKDLFAILVKGLDL